MDLLLLHGALGSKKQFTELSVVLSPYFNVHTMDFEGHGDYKSSSDFSIDAFVNNVWDYLEKHNLKQVSIFGYSMGGYVAMKAALTFPEKIDTITTLGTKVDWSRASAEKEIKLLNPETIELKLPQFARALNEEQVANNWKIVMHKTAKFMLDLADNSCLSEEDFRNIKNEVVVGIGELDNMVTYEESSWLAATLPHGKLVTLEQCQHPIQKVKTDLLANFIKICLLK